MSSRTRRRVVRGLLAVGVLGGGIGLGIAVSWVQRVILSELPEDLSAYHDYHPRTSCLLQDASGARIDEFWLERRIWVDLDLLPAHVVDAFLSAEDRRFREHHGVDWPGIARALWSNLTSGARGQGGSTITQQLVKNLIVGNERTYVRKIREAVLALRLERELSKDEILELYLNHIALGSGNHGVEAAALDYFGVPATKVDVGQAALLAGLVPAPSRYSPRSDPELARERRRLVLRAMVRDGHLTAEEAAAWLDAPVITPQEPPLRTAVDAAYLTAARREVRRLFGDLRPFDEGLIVRTGLDPDVQLAARDAVRAAVDGHRVRQGPVAIRRRGVDEARFVAAARDLPRDDETGEVSYPPRGSCFEAVVPAKGGLDVLRAGPHTVSLAAADRRQPVSLEPDDPPARLERVARPGDVLALCRGEDDVILLDPKRWAQSAAVVIEHATGRVVAMVGGYDDRIEGFNRAMQAKRQPGSAFKPIVYAAALARGRSQLDVMVDAPLSLPGVAGPWRPKNYGGTYSGAVTLRRALSKSINTIAVRLALETGVERVADTARDLGVRTPLRLDPTMALGSSEVTPMDLALAYATLARSGVGVEPVLLTSVRDASGATAGPGASLDGIQLPGGPGRRVLPAGVAYEVFDMMREVVVSGTARRAYQRGKDRSGKTGTTNRYVDAWFVGSTATHTIAVWVGTDGSRTLGPGETGGKAALPAWIGIAAALGDPAIEQLPAPPAAIWVPWEGGRVAVARGTAPASILRR